MKFGRFALRSGVAMDRGGKADVYLHDAPATSVGGALGALTTSVSGLSRSRLPRCRYRQQPGQARAELVGAAQLTFPDGDNAPAESS